MPEQFNFPFYYDPHPLAKIAAREVQVYLKTQNDFRHNYGLGEHEDLLAIGKMFGVLVVKDPDGQLGFLAAYSGKLAESNQHDYFVPPVFDMLSRQGHFKTEEERINAINTQIDKIELDPQYVQIRLEYEKTKANKTEQLLYEKIRLKLAKKERDRKRLEASNTLDSNEYKTLIENLKNDSLKRQWFYKNLKQKWEARIAFANAKMMVFQNKVNSLKKSRKKISAELQQWLFDQYKFLNSRQETKTLKGIFENEINGKPPAGAGECAAPKLLQYAFLNDLTPVNLAEFWWGAPPSSEIRKHGNFYPSCRGKCLPILNHMLQGIKMDPNPMLNLDQNKKIDVIYEDETICLINKPNEFLSVPGKSNIDSVYTRVSTKYPKATGPLLVHRLDMSTSGIMLIAKTKEAHKYLQRQFIKREVNKRYVALLNGIVEGNEGCISLPLRVDLNDRPRQVVCDEHGKNAITQWKVVTRQNGKTRILLYPKTGRTHQLRVHMAHHWGLDASIIGDDLYGQKLDRLHLHAEYLSFRHPLTKAIVEFKCNAPF